MVYDNIVSAVLRDHPEAIRSLGSEIRNINEIKSSGHSLLFTAMSAGFEKSTEALLSIGATWGDDQEKFHLIHKSLETDSAWMMKVLITTKSVDLYSRDEYGYSLLHFVSSKGLVAITGLLVTLGINIDVKSQNLLTPLHYAAMEGSLPGVKVLIERGADLGVRTTEGYLPIHSAALSGHCGIIEELCKEEGLNYINCTDYSDRTPRALAVLHNRIEAEELLRSKGGLI